MIPESGFPLPFCRQPQSWAIALCLAGTTTALTIVSASAQTPETMSIAKTMAATGIDLEPPPPALPEGAPLPEERFLNFSDASEADTTPPPLPGLTEPLPSPAAPRLEQPRPATPPPEPRPAPAIEPGLTAPLPSPAAPQVTPPTLPRIGEPQLLTPALTDRLLGVPTTPSFDTYRLGPGDGIFVNVQRFADLSFQGTLDLQGNVVVPLQGVVTLQGLTINEAANLISRIYDQYVVDPNVSITLVAQRGVEVTVLGEVVRPGYYPLPSPQVTTALLTAGGSTGQADLRSVRIQRRLPNGQLLESIVDLFTPLLEGAGIPDVPLQDGDVILVSRLDPAALDEYDRDLVARSTLAQPQIVVRVLNYGGGRTGIGSPGSATLSALVLPNGSRFADALVNTALNPDSANIRQVALVRFDPEAGRALTTVLDGNAAFRGDPSENPPLQHNDVIILERTLLAKLTYGLSVFTQPFRDVLGFLLFFDQLANSATNLFGP